MRPLQIPNIVDTEQLEAADSTFKAGVEDKIENLSHMEWQDVLRSLATDLMHIALKIAIACFTWAVG